MASEDQPKLVSHCAALYAKMDGEAKVLDGVNESIGERIWEGKIIEACRLIGITPGSYSRVVNSLRTLGCIEQVSQGYRNKPSVFRIHYPPTPEVWDDRAPETTKDLTSRPSSDTMSAAIKNLETQLGGVNVVEALAKVQERLDAQDRQLQELRKRLPTANGS